ncbi:type II secretion system protein [Vibrio vulnificus]|uniref:MSHA pilin protein MshA n=1 Tax=Vibrio vulnificus TaxID=672 RepID=A0AAN1PLB9_VIBVL|nr:type II secretion system protein [Vibrio vulnificus]ADV85394.1 MSHA pilin protein MshA [Vibrio vulnificus MO6-24/O]AXX58685.1 MSHA pilin protein MshA [Vibrio vulnificus]EGR0038532.1 type II secretion system protein [Vibrio vulnificus]EGR0092712.1 type II secretion system protein [Vibrio vulnificus]EGR0095692.1 type II secretion system protein [Vibrio vulnificus]
MKRQGGFTLIELVVVIVILGILAVTAAPRFLNLQDDARVATLEGLRGAIAGASGIVYGKAAVAGLEATERDATATPPVAPVVENGNGGNIDLTFGYPTASTTGVMLAIDVSNEFAVIDSANDDNTDNTNAWIDIGITGYTNNCVRYTAATNATTPATAQVVSGAGFCGQ